MLLLLKFRDALHLFIRDKAAFDQTISQSRVILHLFFSLSLSAFYPSVPILKPDHVFQFRRRSLQNITIFDGSHAVSHPRRDMKTVSRLEPKDLSFPLALYLQIHSPAQQTNGLILDPMILITQRLPFLDMENLPDITVRVCPDELIAPRLLDLFAYIDVCFH